MIGIDIIEISRIEEMIDDTRFIKKIFTTKEQDYCNKALVKNVRASRYAVRFAAKEAVFKALDCLEFLAFSEIEVFSEETGKPILKFYGDTKKRIKKENINIHLSLSHCHSFATATALVEKT